MSLTDPQNNLAAAEDLSIIMAVYNHEATIAEALDSALMQEMPYTSVIYCFNDASTDKSGDILEDYATRYPGKIKIFTNPTNLGSGKKSFLYHQPPIKGRYWCLLAGDDYWTNRDKAAKQIAFLDDHPYYTGCSCNTLMKNEMTGEESIIKPDLNTWNLLDLMLLREGFSFYVHTSSIIWRNVYLKHGFFLPKRFNKTFASGDVMLMHSMLGDGGKMYNIPETMSCYRFSGCGVWSGLSENKQRIANKELAKKINRVIPLKFRIYVYLHKKRASSKIISSLFIPGPVNDPWR